MGVWHRMERVGVDGGSRMGDMGRRGQFPWGRLTFPLGPVSVDVLGLRASDGDQRAGIMSALGSLVNGGVLTLAPGTYEISRYVPMVGMRGVTIEGRGATIVYPSADTALVADGVALTNPSARCAFLVKGCSGITFRGITFRGSEEDTITTNTGAAVFSTHSTDTRVEGCVSNYGASLFQSDAFVEDVGARILGNTIYGARGNLTCGDFGVIAHNRFELPSDADYDRIGVDGSSHAIYLFAGRDGVVIEGNVFQNIRTFGFKASGSSLPMRDIVVKGNIFRECGGGVQWGADDNQEHSNCIIEGNTFYNCGNVRLGWAEGQTIQALGCRSVLIRGNGFHWNRDCDASISVASISAIQVSRYTGSSSPVENVMIEGNGFYGDVRTDFATTPQAILTHVVDVQEVGSGTDFFTGQAKGFGTLIVRGNVVKRVGADLINAVRCTALVVDSNEVAGLQTFGTLTGCRIPRITNNTYIPNVTASSNAHLKMNKCSFPILYGNYSMDRAQGSNSGKGTTIGDNAGGSTPVDFPLLGMVGRHRSSEGRQEVVMAYGDGWADGDTVVLDGNTFTYKASSPGAGEFNTAATLIALIDALANYTCVDYGATWGITTNHLWIRRATASASADQFNVQVTAAHPCAGVILTNGGSTVGACYSRGGEAAGPGTLTVVWSPLAHMHSQVSFEPDNASAVTLLASPAYVASRLDRHSGSNLVVTHGAIAGTEEFRWGLAG